MPTHQSAQTAMIEGKSEDTHWFKCEVKMNL